MGRLILGTFDVRRLSHTKPIHQQDTGDGAGAVAVAEGVAAAWRAARTQVLNDAVQVHLLPMLEVEARRLLKQRAEEGVLREAGMALRRVVETGMCVARAWCNIISEF